MLSICLLLSFEKIDLVWNVVMPNCRLFRFSARISAALCVGFEVFLRQT